MCLRKKKNISGVHFEKTTIAMTYFKLISVNTVQMCIFVWDLA